MAQWRGWIKGWFGWWVAGCMILLAYNTHQQVQTQQRILERSRNLDIQVAAARDLTLATNGQLADVTKLSTATGGLSEKLQKAGVINSALRKDLATLDTTVQGIRQSIERLDAQTVQSNTLLSEIAHQSALLEEKLKATRQIGAQVSDHIEAMIGIQEGVNVDLAEMRGKTQLLDKFTGGR